MPRPTEIERNPMAQAVRRFRASLGDTQREFAERTGLALTSIARYETNAQPSKEVLAKFAEIAKDENLPLFAAIFGGQVAPDPLEFERQELSAGIRLLQSGLVELNGSKYGYRKAKLLLAIHVLSPSKYSEAERLLRKLVPDTVIDEILNTATGELVRRGPRVNRQTTRFLCLQCGLISDFLTGVLEKTRKSDLDNKIAPAPLKCYRCHVELKELPDDLITTTVGGRPGEPGRDTTKIEKHNQGGEPVAVCTANLA